MQPRLKGDSILDLLLPPGARTRSFVSAFQSFFKVLRIVSTIWRNSATSSSRRLEAATLAEAGLDVVDLGLGGGGAGVATGG